MKIDPYPRFPADPRYLERKLTDLFRNVADEFSKMDNRVDELEMATQYATQYDQDADPPSYAYLGHAVPGTATSAATWRIQKLTFGAGGDVSTQWADGNSNFDNVWDNRASLSYS